jgi:hypothetical protein
VKKLAVVITAAALTVGGGAISGWSASTPTPATNNSSSGESESTAEPRRGDGGAPIPPMHNPSRQWSRENLLRPIGREEWDAVDWFMNRFTPTRWQKFKEMPDDRHKERLKTILANRYRVMQELKVNDTDTYSLRVRRLQIEDRIFDLGWRVNHNGEPPTSQPVVAPDQPANARAAGPFANMTQDQLRTELRKEVRSLIANRVEERRLHVKQLTERLNAETARLNAEQGNVEQLVEAGMKNIEKQRWPGIGGELVPPMPSGGGSGGGPRSRNVNTEEAREPAAVGTIAPAETSEQQ